MRLNRRIFQRTVESIFAANGFEHGVPIHVTTDPTVTGIFRKLIVLKEIVEKMLADVLRDWHEHPSGQEAQPTPTRGAYFDFNLRLLTRSDVDPAELPDELCIRLLEALLRQGRRLSCIDWLQLPRFKINQINHGTPVGDPSRAFRHDVDALRKFLKLAGVPIRITTERGHIRADFDPDKVRSNVIEAAQLACEARKRLRSLEIFEAHQAASRALDLDPDCSSAAVVISKVAQRSAKLLNHENIQRAELALARGIITSVAAILRLNAKAASGFAQITRAHQRALNLINCLDRNRIALRSSTSLEPDDFRNMLGEFMQIATAVGRGARDVSLGNLARTASMVALTTDLLAARIEKHHPDRAAVVENLTTRIVWLLLIYGELPAATSEERFVEALREFLERKLDWPSLLNRNDRRTIQYDDDAFESDEDDSHRQRTHRGRRRRERADDD